MLSAFFVFSINYDLAKADSQLPPKDCEYSGKGSVFILDKKTGQFIADQKNSYALTATRHPIGPGQYLFQEIKTFNDDRPQQVTMFYQGMFVGSFDSSAPDGSLISKGYCPEEGLCSGILILPQIPYEGRFVTRFDSKSIRTTTFDARGTGFVEESLIANGVCEFRK